MTKYKLHEVCDIVKGSTPIKKAIPGQYSLVVTAEERSSSIDYQFDTKAVCVPLVSSTGHGHASIHRLHYQEGRFALGSILAAVIPKNEKILNPKFLFVYLSYLKDLLLVPLMKGGANVALTVTKLKTVEIQIPPINKQLEIIEKCELLNGNHQCLIKELYDEEVLINKLRLVILRDAVQGKLVPQDPNDEPASELLKKIKAEKERLIKEKKIRKEKPMPTISKDEIPYELPEGWEWVRIRDISHDWGQKVPDKNITYIDVSSINKEKGVISKDIKLLTPNKAPSRARKIVKKETVIYSTVRPYLLNIAIIDKEFQPEPIASTAFAILHPFSGILNKYLYHYLRSKVFTDYVEKQMRGMAYPAINDSKMNLGLVPLPTLNEQKRIVARVDQLLQLCDQLESHVKENQENSELLMDAVLKEAFAIT